MAYGRPANVRSHRRGGRRKKLKIAPWIIVVSVTALVLSGIGVGYAYLIRSTCSGSVKATIIASPSIYPILDSLGRQWEDTEPSVNGVCASVEIEAKDSAVMAQALGNDWDPKTNGTPPDVWVPESSVWIRQASADSDAERMMPDRQPSLARTPVVIGMPKDMATALGWPKKPIDWSTVLSGTNWSTYGKPWGEFKFGMTDPNKSTAGLLALMSMLDHNDDGEITPEERSAVLRLKQVMSRGDYQDSTGKILSTFAKQDAQGKDSALQYLSAFPALEQDLVAYNLNNPKEPLVAVYPTSGSADADHPYLVLNAPWSNPQRKAAASAFLEFARGSQGRAAFLSAGFRDSNRNPGKDLTEANGFSPQVPTLPRAVLLPESVKQSLATWTALTRPTNMLLVLDVSGSMAQTVPGTGKSRLALAQDAASNAIKLFGDDARVGLWAFSTNQDNGKDYRQVVPIGRLGDRVGSTTRKQALLSGIASLHARGDTGLYDTVAAAQKAVMDNFVAGATNLVVLLTDGKNEKPGGGLTLDQLKNQLKQNGADGNRAVPVVTVGYGDQADFSVLQQISALTNTESFSSKDAFDINEVLLSAVFGQV
ncbi:MAG TPA: substrate-binding and VWA domain-containing protein [Micromonosporaceae bacterium]